MLIEISSKAPQDGQSISCAPVTFGKFRDITDYIGQRDISDTFIPKGNCIHQEMLDNGFSASNGGFLATFLAFLFRVVLKKSAIRIRKSDNVPWSQ